MALRSIPQVRILESYYQSIRESFTSTLESNCQFVGRLTHCASRNIHREVQLPLLRTASDCQTADSVILGLCHVDYEEQQSRSSEPDQGTRREVQDRSDRQTRSRDAGEKAIEEAPKRVETHRGARSVTQASTTTGADRRWP